MSRLAVFTAPLTLERLLDLHQLHVNRLPMIVHGILLQMLPLTLGKLIARRRADVAARLQKPLRRVVAVASVAALAAFVVRSGVPSLVLLGDRGWLAVGIVAGALSLFAWLLGGAGGARRRALIACGLSSNLALALMLATLAFPDSHVPLAVFGVWLLLLGVGYGFARIVRLERTQRTADASAG
jgi:predicted Na+-dependent transporter